MIHFFGTKLAKYFGLGWVFSNRWVWRHCQWCGTVRSAVQDWNWLWHPLSPTSPSICPEFKEKTNKTPNLDTRITTIDRPRDVICLEMGPGSPLTWSELLVLNSIAVSFHWFLLLWQCTVTSVGWCLVDLKGQIVIWMETLSSFLELFTWCFLRFEVGHLHSLDVGVQIGPRSL